MHIITSLGHGGAQQTLLQVLAANGTASSSATVVCLREALPFGPRIEALGIPVHDLRMRPGRAGAADILRLHRLIRHHRPALVQTWLYHADLLGGLAARLAGVPRVVWNIRQGNLDADKNRWHTRAVAKCCAWLSRRVPDRIVCNAESAARAHQAYGYAAERFVHIPNGFDLDRFRPDPAARAALRAELGLGRGDAAEAVPLVGLIGRFDAQKDHRGFVEAAGRIAAARPAARFVLAGNGVHAGNARLHAWLRTAGVLTRAHLLGARDDVPAVMAALDVLVSSSSGEAFANVLGEAMACGVPCVATDVGDSARIVGDTGRVVPPHRPDLLAAAVTELLDLTPADRARLGAAARARVRAQYALADVAARYARLYRELLATGG